MKDGSGHVSNFERKEEKIAKDSILSACQSFATHTPSLRVYLCGAHTQGNALIRGTSKIISKHAIGILIAIENKKTGRFIRDLEVSKFIRRITTNVRMQTL